MTVYVYPKDRGKGRGSAPNQQQVVATAPSVAPVTSSAAAPQGWGEYASGQFGGMSAAQRAAFSAFQRDNPLGNNTPALTPSTLTQPTLPRLPGLGTTGGGFAGSGTSGSASSGDNSPYTNAADTRDFLDKERIRFADEDSKAGALRDLQKYYMSGGYRQGGDELMAQLAQMGVTQAGDVNAAYDRSTANFDDAYGAAGKVAATGFDALNKYLTENPNNPYAGFNAQAGVASNPMQDYLARYGVGDRGGDVAAQVAMEQSQNQAGADNYNNLAALLSGNAQQGDRSRMAEMQMAQQLSGLNLGSDLAGFKSGSANARASALAEIANNTASGRFQLQESQNTIAEQLRQQILAAGGDLQGGTSVVQSPRRAGPVAPVATPVAPVATAKETKGAKAMGKTAGPGKHWEKSPKGKWIAVANKKGAK